MRGKKELFESFWRMGHPLPAPLPPTDSAALDAWIDAATTDLVSVARHRVASEITAHFSVERDAQLALGMQRDAAEGAALQHLGPVRSARRRFNAAYLTHMDEHRIAFVTGNKPIRARFNRWQDALTAILSIALLGLLLLILLPEPLGPSSYILPLMGAVYAPCIVGRALYLCLGERMLREIMLGIALFEGAIALAFAFYIATRARALLASGENPLFLIMFVLALPILALVSLRVARKLPKTKGPVQS